MNASPGVLAKKRIETPLGTLWAYVSDSGVRAILFAESDLPRNGVHGDVVERPRHRTLCAVSQQITQYFSGTRVDFDLPLDPVGTEFQRAAWMALRQIPFGETVSYGDQALAIGRPLATRAIGAANGRNPLTIVVPCHRVIGKAGGLTGFSAGLDRKRWLLAHEGALHKKR